MGLRQKNNCDWGQKMTGEIRLACPSVCPKASREINSFGTVFCLKLGQSNLSEYLEIERKFVSVWDKVLKKDWDKKCKSYRACFCPSICPKQSLFQEQDLGQKITTSLGQNPAL